MIRWTHQLRIVFGNELRRQTRRRELLIMVWLLAAGVVLALVLASEAPRADLTGPAIWIGGALAAASASKQLYGEDLQNGTFKALLCGPTAPTVIFVAKTLVAWLIILSAALLCGVLSCFFLGANLTAHPVALTAVLFSGSLSLALVAGLVGAQMHPNQPESVLTLALLPLLIPVLVAGGQATRGLVAPPLSTDAAETWLPFLLASNLLFGALGLWTFEPLSRR
jgi:heme exporter protein B